VRSTGSGHISTVSSGAASVRSTAIEFSDIFLEAAAQGEVWTETALDGFIANPDGYLPGTAMVFRGIRAAQDRADLIAFIVEEGATAEAGEDVGPAPRSRRSSGSRATSPTANTCRRNAPPAISARAETTFRRSEA
jgi:hypothetical protein